MRKILFKLFVPLIALFFLSTTQAAGTTHYIIDTDMGFDDWMAVLYLLKQPVMIDAITVDCEGETRCPQGGANAARLTHLAKRDVPIAMGRSRNASPLDFPKKIRDYATEMKVPDFLNIPVDKDITTMSAATLILHNVLQAQTHGDKVVIISIGSATNIADAWQLAKKMHQTAAFRLGLEQIYKGGGAVGDVIHHHFTNQHIPGNINIPGLIQSENTVAEWNIYVNAPAMQTLLSAKLPITFVPNNATDKINITEDSYDTLYRNSKPHTPERFCANALLTLVSSQGGWRGIANNLDFWDTATTMAALNPALVAEKIMHVPVSVVLKPGNTYAEIQVDTHQNDFVTVDYRLNKKMFYQLIEKAP